MSGGTGPSVVVVGLGPAGPDLVTAGTLEAIERIPHRFLRTNRHPSAPVVPEATTFDDVYERGAGFGEVYAEIVEVLVRAAHNCGEVLYAVPGSPLVAERTVSLLVADERVDTTVLPAVGFADLAWARLGVDPVAAGARLVDGRQFELDAAGERGPLLVAQCDQRHVLSEIKLVLLDDDPASAPEPVTVLSHLGLPDEHVRSVAVADLDRAVEPDHLTSLWVPRLAAPIAGEVARFAALVRELRARCPWDRQQTHRTLVRHLVEEAYELVDAISVLDEASGAGDDHLAEELGDLLFQVVFHATLAQERGAFTLADVATGIHDKLVGRHPHVFGPGAGATTAGAVEASWEQLKQVEKGRASVLDGVPRSLPALQLAAKVQRKATAVGVDVPGPAGSSAAVFAFPLLPAINDDAALGDLLFAVVAAARAAGLDPEAALRAATDRFAAAVRAAEARLTPNSTQ